MRFLRVLNGLATRWLAVALLLGSAPLAQAQVSGNQVMGRASRSRYQTEEGRAATLPTKLFLTDSTFVLGANVMQHVRADSYVAVFGLRQEALSVAAAERRLTARVQHFTGRLRQLGVASEEVYTDIIAQKRIKDVKITRNSAPSALAGFTGEEYLRGFESTRNVIVAFKRIGLLDDMLVAAAADSIFDLVKVDYIVDNPEAVYTNLFKEAAEVINRKKASYLLLTNAQLRPAAQPYAEEFASFVPAGQYQSYEAAVTAPYRSSGYSDNDGYKGLPALTTYYYSPPSADGFDRVINPVVIEPAVTFTLAVQVKYTLQAPPARRR